MKTASVMVLISILWVVRSGRDKYTEAYDKIKAMCRPADPEQILTMKDIQTKHLLRMVPSLLNVDKYLPVAKGGYGCVFVNFAKKKVKKVIKRARLRKASSLNTTINEINIGNKLFKMGNPMMVQNCEIIVDDAKQKIRYLALDMDYIKGMDMSDYLEDDRRKFKDVNCAKDLNFTVVLLKQVKLLHDMGMMHRDIKPSNIYLEIDDDNRYSKLWLIDYGFASFDEYDTSYKATDSYAPPEILASARYNKRIDIFSLGATLFDIFFDYADEGIKDSPCNSNALFHTINQMLQYNFEGDDCDHFDESGELFANRCRLSITRAVQLFEAIYKLNYVYTPSEDQSIAKFLKLNQTRVSLNRFSGNGFFGYYYNTVFDGFHELITRRDYSDYF